MLTACVLVSCAPGGASAASQLVGRWRSSQGAQAAEYRFLADGRFDGRVTAGSVVVSDFTGRWSLREGTIIYEYTSDRLGAIAVGTLDRDKLLAMARDHYLIEAADGSRRTYVRIAE